MTTVNKVVHIMLKASLLGLFFILIEFDYYAQIKTKQNKQTKDLSNLMDHRPINS